MLDVVLDTNVIVSGTIIRRGVPFVILEAWRAGAFRLVSSRHQQRELIDALKRPKFLTSYDVTRQDIAVLVRRMRRTALIVSLASSVPSIARDPDDDFVISAAMNGPADLLVTGDKDLLSLVGDHRLGNLTIISPAAFVPMIGP